jgi:molybdopterin-binding protein
MLAQNDSRPAYPRQAFRAHTCNPKESFMKVSARNLIPGTVKKVIIGMVNAEVVIEAAPGVEIVSVITKESAEALGLAAGSKVKAMVKASDVLIITD